MIAHKNIFFLLFLLALVFSQCKKKDDELKEFSQLEFYLEQHKSKQQDILIGCAAGSDQKILGDALPMLSIFFYVVDSASDFRCFKTKTTNVNETNFKNYSRWYLDSDTLFNGRMQRFKLPNDTTERWVVLTYLSPGKIHISDPIRVKISTFPTYHIDSLLTITPNGVHPQFNWASEIEPNNIIYFEVIADTANNMISGTYTNDKWWNFYDLSNVVLNVTPGTTEPHLNIGSNYSFTLMGVSEDNWVHTVAQKNFQTN